MHSHVRKFKYRLLAQPVGFFEQIHEVFAPSDDIFVLLACVDGRAIAGVLFIIWKNTLYYKFNASVDQELRPNDLLMWEGIKWGCRRKLQQLDLGYSDVSQPGLISYKRKYATSEQPITTLQWQPSGYVDCRADEAHSTLCRMTHLLTDPSVPDEITRAAGDTLYRFFS
jgi:hypothetical protein